MANDINVVVLVGRLTRDCELRSTAGGSSVCRFSIAVNRRRKNGDTWTDEANYFDIVLWGRQADSLKSYLLKGRGVSIEGGLRQSRWEQDGQTRSRIEVVANNVQLLSSSQGSASGMPVPERDNGLSPQMAQSVSSAQDFGPEQFEDDSDIPF
ncbi:MAG: single-stranded DNA-binding protein [Sphaerochaetaceae bacterium]|nr:single-stranded DNA-binding protein [Sphaerochaetaceae bacterium]